MLASKEGQGPAAKALVEPSPPWEEPTVPEQVEDDAVGERDVGTDFDEPHGGGSEICESGQGQVVEERPVQEPVLGEGEAQVAEPALAELQSALPGADDVVGVAAQTRRHSGHCEPLSAEDWRSKVASRPEAQAMGMDQIAALAAKYAERAEDAPGLGVEEFARSASGMASLMDEDHLHSYAAELSGALVRGHRLRLRRFEGRLAAAEAERRAWAAAREESVLARHRAESERALQEWRLCVEEAIRGRLQQLEAELSDWVAEKAEASSRAAPDLMEELAAAGVHGQSRGSNALAATGSPPPVGAGIEQN